MKILVFEYVTGGGLSHQALPAGLAREGGLMLMALLNDLACVTGIETIVFRDPRLGQPLNHHPGQRWIMSQPDRDIWDQLAAEIRQVDAVWPIAPETDGTLERACAMVERAGKCLLNSPSRTVRLASSKGRTLERLAACGMAVVPSVRTGTIPRQPPFAFPLVAKPDDGAGCEGSRIMISMVDWQSFLDSPKSGEWLVQPLIEGDPLSLSVIFSDGEARVLTVNRQLIRRKDEGFILEGCQVNALSDTQGVLARLADDIAAAIPDLWGYSGVDLIHSDQGFHVLEINPRLTSSYAGIREAIGVNVADCVLHLAETGRLPTPRIFSGQMMETVWHTAG